jgi:hypothetical protein
LSGSWSTLLREGIRLRIGTRLRRGVLLRARMEIPKDHIPYGYD